MTELSNDLLSQWNPIHEQSDYRCAVNCLRLVSTHYDTASRHSDQARVFVSEMAIGRNRERCVALLDAAVKLVDPRSNVFYNSQTGELCFEFDASKSEKPPIRQAIYQLDALKETIFSNSVRDTQGNYLIRQPKKLDPNILDVIFFIGHYQTGDYPVTEYYKLPGSETFTHSDGKTYQPGELIDTYSLMQFVSTHPEMDGALKQQLPESAMIEPPLMQEIMTQLECRPKRGADLN